MCCKHYLMVKHSLIFNSLATSPRRLLFGELFKYIKESRDSPFDHLGTGYIQVSESWHVTLEIFLPQIASLNKYLRHLSNGLSLAHENPVSWGHTPTDDVYGHVELPDTALIIPCVQGIKLKKKRLCGTRLILRFANDVLYQHSTSYASSNALFLLPSQNTTHTPTNYQPWPPTPLLCPSPFAPRPSPDHMLVSCHSVILQ